MFVGGSLGYGAGVAVDHKVQVIPKPDNLRQIKDTWYLWGKNSENMQLLDVLVCNLAN